MILIPTAFGNSKKPQVLLVFMLILSAFGSRVIGQQLPLLPDTGNPVQKLVIESIGIAKPEGSAAQIVGNQYRLQLNQASSTNPTIQALFLVPGLQVRDYGGIGGLKAISSRGLGAEHTQVSLNGMPIGGNSLAYTDFSLIPSALLTSLNVNNGALNSARAEGTASQHTGGPHIDLRTSTGSVTKLQVGLEAGSFGWLSPHALGRVTHQIGSYRLRSHLGLQYQQAKGDYPFSYSIGNAILKDTRTNSGLWSVGLAGGFVFDKTPKPDSFKDLKHPQCQVGIDYFFNQSMRQLPGAVVLYNLYSGQTLDQTQSSVSAFGKVVLNQGSLLHFRITHQSDNTRYRDPAYLNGTGGVDNQYFWNSLSGSTIADYTYNGLSLSPQLDLDLQYLGFGPSATDSYQQSPKRTVLMPLLRMGYQPRWAANGLSLFATVSRWVLRETPGRSDAEQMQQDLPTVGSMGLNARILDREHLTLTFSPISKWHNRLPTMAELYYGQTAMRQLNPEKVWMTSLTMDLLIRCHPDRDNYVKLKATTFYQRNQDKIIAIPTRDLFIWSIQNIGLAEGYGIETFAEGNWQLGKDWLAHLTISYTYQQLQDRSNPNSANYGGQLPYLPVATGGFKADVGNKRIQLSWQTFISSYRYSLAQNIKANLLPGYVINDCSLTYRFDVGAKIRHQDQPESRFVASLGINNLIDTQYQVLQSFPMPGRQLKFGLVYNIF